MPRFLDIHQHAQGLTREQVADAHAKDVAVQGKYGVTFVRYWYDAFAGIGQVVRVSLDGDDQASGDI